MRWPKPETEVRTSDEFIRDRYVRAMRRECVVVKWCLVKCKLLGVFVISDVSNTYLLHSRTCATGDFNIQGLAIKASVNR